MIEQFERGILPSKESWEAYIESLRAKAKPATKKQVESALIEAVRKRVPNEGFGVFLSGGVDSSLIALLLKKFTNNFVCYSVGLEGSSDLAAAKKVAEEFKLNHVIKEFKTDEILPFLKEAKSVVPTKDLVSISVASVVIAAARLAEKDSLKMFFGGLGAEEIFAGYKRHLSVKDVNEECWRGLSKMWKRDLERDGALGSYLKIGVRVPFLDEQVILAAMGIDGNKKISTEHKKIILREIAEELGLPKEIAWRKKLAAQYGSGFDKALERLAKRNKQTKAEFLEAL